MSTTYREGICIPYLVPALSAIHRFITHMYTAVCLRLREVLALISLIETHQDLTCRPQHPVPVARFVESRSQPAFLLPHSLSQLQMWGSQSSTVVVPPRLTRLNRVSRAPRKRDTDKPRAGACGFWNWKRLGWVYWRSRRHHEARRKRRIAAYGKN